jgi:putative transcriptional regulator
MPEARGDRGTGFSFAESSSHLSWRCKGYLHPQPLIVTKWNLGNGTSIGLAPITPSLYLRLRSTASGPAPPQAIRAQLNLSQAAFAGLMGVSVRPVQDWEQERREPSGPAKALLRIAEQQPEVFAHLT